jgi:hypothetical protein
MTNENLREQLESVILDAQWNIEVKLYDFIWFDSNEVEAFLTSWRDLVGYYASHADEIGIDMLYSYIHFMRFFINLMFSADGGQDSSEQGEALLTYLEEVVAEIIREVAIYRESQLGNL